jgi:hypothetical protein
LNLAAPDASAFVIQLKPQMFQAIAATLGTDEGVTVYVRVT